MSREIDLLKLIRIELGRRGWTACEASRMAGMSSSAVNDALNGTRTISAKFFQQLVERWDIISRPPLLQEWVVAWLHFTFGPLRRAPWLARLQIFEESIESTGVVPQGLERYAPLRAPSGRAARRRLEVLRRIAATKGGEHLPALISTGWETRNVIQGDLVQLEKAGLITVGAVEEASLHHPFAGRQESAVRRGQLRRWVATPAGHDYVAESADLDGLQEKDLVGEHHWG